MVPQIQKSEPFHHRFIPWTDSGTHSRFPFDVLYALSNLVSRILTQWPRIVHTDAGYRPQ